ncbi:copper transport protein-like protein [Dipodascopsis uninucleata]
MSTSWSESLKFNSNENITDAHGDVLHGVSACSMNMLFTWDAMDMCVVFNWWQVSSKGILALTFLGVVGLGICYELLREMTRRYEQSIQQLKFEDVGNETTPLLMASYIPRRSIYIRLILSLLYAFQVLYSFFLMLIFMSYNGIIMAAVVIGAFIGFFLFGSKHRLPQQTSGNIGTTAVRGNTCH